MNGKLTAAQIKRLIESGERKLHNDGYGLYLQVSKPGSASWIYRHEINGRRHDMGLGPTDLIGLAEARRRAHRYRQQRFDGFEPLEHRRAKRTPQAEREAN